MTELDKYFVPDISELRIGYEMEFDLGVLSSKSQIVHEWSSFVLKGIGNAVKEYLKKGWYRTPYLTKEQIENEGWTSDIEHMSVFYRGGYLLKLYIEHINEIISYKIFIFNPREAIFQGECKDINTFKWICKLLKIN